MLSNAYFLAKFRFDTAENEPAKNLQILPILLTNFAADASFGPKTVDTSGNGLKCVRATVVRPLKTYNLLLPTSSEYGGARYQRES